MPITHPHSPRITRGRRWAAALPLAVAAIGLIAAGCGSSSSKPAAAGNGNAKGSAVPTLAPASTTAVTVGRSTLGSVLTDGQGRTLYLFEKDTSTTSNCYGPCASAWPPVITSGPAVVGGGAKQAELATTARKDGTMQLTYAGHPLYRFVGDSKPGDTNGQGSQAFGAGWDVLSPAGQKIESGG